MGLGKLKKFAELGQMANVYQKPDPQKFSGKWHTIFGNDNPIILELACGKGDYTLALAERFPAQNFLGIDIKGHRIHVGARQATERMLHNVRFLRIYIDHVEEYFAAGEIQDIWITFPDPYLKKRQCNKRLTSPRFLERYRKILSQDGTIQLKTDSPELFTFTKDVIQEQNLEVISIHENVYKEDDVDHLLTDIQTHYENMHLKDERTIRAVKFRP